MQHTHAAPQALSANLFPSSIDNRGFAIELKSPSPDPRSRSFRMPRIWQYHTLPVPSSLQITPWGRVRSTSRFYRVERGNPKRYNLVAMNETLLQQILDSIADGVFTVDLEGRITSFNRSAQKITGFSREEAVGQYCFDIFRTDICEAGCPLDESMKSGKQIVDRTATILAKDGREVPINMSTAVLRDKSDEIVGGAETFRDLSAIEELRRELLGKYSFGDIVSNLWAWVRIRVAT